MTLTAEEWKKRLNWVDEDAAVYGEKDWHRDIFALLADLEAAQESSPLTDEEMLELIDSKVNSLQERVAAWMSGLEEELAALEARQPSDSGPSPPTTASPTREVPSAAEPCQHPPEARRTISNLLYPYQICLDCDRALGPDSPPESTAPAKPCQHQQFLDYGPCPVCAQQPEGGQPPKGGRSE